MMNIKPPTSNSTSYILLKSLCWKVEIIMLSTNKIKAKDSNRQVWENMGMCMFLCCEFDSLITTICLSELNDEEEKDGEKHCVPFWQWKTNKRCKHVLFLPQVSVVTEWLACDWLLPKGFILLWTHFKLAWHVENTCTMKNLTVFIKGW